MSEAMPGGTAVVGCIRDYVKSESVQDGSLYTPTPMLDCCSYNGTEGFN